MRDGNRLGAINKVRARARAARAAAKECREQAEALIAKARRLRQRRGVKVAASGNSRRPHLKELDESLAALKQSLRDLEAVRMTSPDDPSLRKLKSDISKTIDRAAKVRE